MAVLSMLPQDLHRWLLTAEVGRGAENRAAHGNCLWAAGSQGLCKVGSALLRIHPLLCTSGEYMWGGEYSGCDFWPISGEENEED